MDARELKIGYLAPKETKVQQHWQRLTNQPASEQDAFAEAERVLSEFPYPFHHPAGVIKRLKGGYLCHHEYRSLPNAQRIFYKIWTREDIADARKRKASDVPVEPMWESEDQKGIVILFYAGPHPKSR